jgi:Domain of unknown function (DUF4410)
MRFKRAAISDLLCGSAVAADARVTVTSMESPKNRRIDMKYLCTYLAMAFCGMLAASFVAAAQDKVVQDNSLQGKSALVVETFTAAPNMAWPYDMRLLQTETVAELRAKDGQRFNVGAESAAEGTSFYRLQGIVTEWHPGNRAKRMLVGMGSGRETATIHYWLVAETGKKVFEHTDTIRAEFWGNAYAGSVGELVHPFADKIAKRLSEAKLE